MLLTITTTHQPATDLGYLLHKHPAKVQTFELAVGKAHVFYPVAEETVCTAALLLDIDPIGLVRDKRSSFSLSQYVNDRPYIASSFLSVAIAQVYGTALNGRCKDRPELVQQAIPLRAKVSVVPSLSGGGLLRELFEPLGYDITVTPHELDAQFPQWGQSHYFTLELTHTIRLSELLSHLYVLIPVLDNDKHYYVDHHEVEKLLQKGEGWLADHPMKEFITTRYLKHRYDLKRAALQRRLDEVEPDSEEEQVDPDEEDSTLDRKVSLHEQRHGTVLSVLKNSGAKRVTDLGCGEGRLLKRLLKEKQFTEIVGMDVSYHSLERAASRLKLEWMAPMQRQRIHLVHGSLIYRDDRLAGYDAAVVVEVIEHLDPPRLKAFERNLFEFMHPGLVIITTPNREYNVK